MTRDYSQNPRKLGLIPYYLWCNRAARLVIVITAMFMLHTPHSVLADEQGVFHDSAHGISLAYPPDLVSESAQFPQAVVALRSRDTGFPTFNIVVQPYTQNSPSELSLFSHGVLAEYRGLGLSDAAIARHYYAESASGPAATTEINYSQRGEKFIAAVTLLTTPREALIATFIDRASQWDAGAALHRTLLGSLRLSGAVSPAAEKELPDWVLAATAIVIALGGALFLRMRRRRA